MTYLLDVNVLVALFDRAHVAHESAHLWFADTGSQGWATSPIVENGVIRVLSNPAYPNIDASPDEIRAHLEALISHQAKHEFWPDDVSLTDASLFRLAHVQGHKQLTDVYLLGLCRRHQGALATMDTRLSPAAIVDGDASLIELLPA